MKHSNEKVSEKIKMYKEKLIIIGLKNKDIRSKIIKKYLGNDKCFCFSCGNASRSLRNHDVNVIGISKDDLLSSNREVDIYDSRFMFGDYFDATSGHLPMTLISEISKEIKKLLPKEMFNNDKKILIPVGSGETMLCFMMLFDVKRLIGFYAENYRPIRFDMTPLKELITNSVTIYNIGHVDSIKQCIDKLFYHEDFSGSYFFDTEPDEVN